MAVSELLRMRIDFTAAIAELIQEATRQGVFVAINEAKRSNEQAIINALGQGGRAHVGALLGGAGWYELAAAVVDNGSANGIRNSLHEKGLAVDLLLYTLDGEYLDANTDAEFEVYKKLGVWWEMKDVRSAWGGRFGDPGHFSFKYQGRK